MEASTLDLRGDEVRVTPTHHFPLPPHLPGRYIPSFNGNNQYRLPDPETGQMKSWTRATSLAKLLDDTYMLNQWRIRKVLFGLSQRLNLQADLAQISDEIMAGEVDPKWERRALNAIAEEAAKAADVDRASEFGTAVHEWAAWVDMGLMSVHDVPELFRAHVAENLRLQALHQILPLPQFTERIVVNSALGIAGTLDRVYLDPRRADGRGVPVLGDVKTSRTLDFSGISFGIQLSFYQSCDLMLSPDGMYWEPMPTLEPSMAYIMHLPSDDIDKAAVQPINLEFGRAALTEALRVRDIRRRADKEATLDVDEILPDPESLVLRRWFDARHLLQFSRSSEEVSALWGRYQDIWTDDLTQIGLATLQALHAHGNENAT